MKTSLYTLTAVCCLAFAASAQVKILNPVKNLAGGPTPNQPGQSLLVVGGSDDCVNASTADAITGLGTFAVTNVGATNGAPDGALPCVNTQLDVWFFWTSTVTGSVDVSTCGGVTADTVLTVWPDDNAGACPTGATTMGCNDDTCVLQSTVTFAAVSGTSYFIQLGAYGAATTYTGTFTIANTPPPPVPPVNNDCSTPIVLSGTVTQPFDNTNATTGTQGQAEAICLFFGTTALNKDVWYTWTPTVAGTVTVTTCGLLAGGNTLDSKVAVYDGAGCPVAAAISCNDDNNTCAGQGLSSQLTFTAVCGQTYTIQLGQYSALATANLLGSMSITEDPLGTPCTPQPTAFCAGDGTLTDHTTPCPCANNGAAGNGCANSANANGANLSVSGSVALDTAVLNGSGMPLTVSCIYLQGTATDDAVFGDGVRCTGGSLLRLRTKTNVGGASSFPDLTDTITLSARGGVTIGSGATRYYQTYYRNSAAAFCPPETFNVTNGMVIIW